MSPGVFVEELAKILGLPAKSIVVIDRALSEAGMRTRGGRGRSAAKVTTADAATLLLAVMATPVLVRADEVTEDWRQVKFLGRPNSIPEPFSAMLESPAPVPLPVFMERLIETSAEGFGSFSFVLEVSVNQKAAMLHVRGSGRRAFDIGFVRYRDEETETSKSVSPLVSGDMTRHAKITDETFRKLHDLFHASSDREMQPRSKRASRT
jgi:hypothetical protein